MLRVNLVMLCVLSTVAFRDDDVAEFPDDDGLEGHDVHSHTPTERGGTYLSSFLDHHFAKYKHKDEKERKKLFKRVIPNIDINKDNEITVDELTSWVIAEIEADTLKYEVAHSQLSHTDENEDGKYSLEEILKPFDYQQRCKNGKQIDVCSAYQCGRTPRDSFPMPAGIQLCTLEGLSHEHGNVPADVLEMDRIREKLKFKMADKNGNGLLDSNEEAARMVLAEHFGDMEPVFIELFLEEFDKNKDGTVTKEEFTKGSAVYPESAQKKEFKNLDKNKDFKLTGKEIEVAALRDLPLYAVKEEMKIIFGMADVKKNGKITYEELAEQHKYFTDKDARLDVKPEHIEL